QPLPRTRVVTRDRHPRALPSSPTRRSSDLPNRTDPELGKKNRDRLLARRNIVLDKMAKLEKITPEEAEEAKKRKLGYKGTPLPGDRKSTRLNSSHVKISYAVFCLKKKKRNR